MPQIPVGYPDTAFLPMPFEALRVRKCWEFLADTTRVQRVHLENRACCTTTPAKAHKQECPPVSCNACGLCNHKGCIVEKDHTCEEGGSCRECTAVGQSGGGYQGRSTTASLPSSSSSCRVVLFIQNRAVLLRRPVFRLLLRYLEDHFESMSGGQSTWKVRAGRRGSCRSFLLD